MGTSADHTHPNVFTDAKWLSSAKADARFDLKGDPKGGRCGVEGMFDGISQLTLVDTDGSLIENNNGGSSTVVNELNPALATDNCDARPGHFACPNLKMRTLKWEA